jgi:AcrR family transcriptional regulator
MSFASARRAIPASVSSSGQHLLQRQGYARTIEAIVQEAQVSAPSVYAIFKSKTGILRELLDQAAFGP